MRCKSIQTIAQGDAQSESSQSQSSTKHKTQKSEVRKISRMKWGTQKPNWTQLKRNIDGSGGFFFSREFRTTRAHIKRAHFICQPAKRKKFLSFSVLSAFCYICIYFFFRNILMYRNFVFPYSMKQIQLLGRVRDDGEKGAGTAREC